MQKAKTCCYRDEEFVTVTETRIDLTLQAILDKTAKRLVAASNCNSSVRNCLPNSSSFKLILKWGCDGSSGHSTCNQKFSGSESTDEFLFLFSFGPLKLVSAEICNLGEPPPFIFYALPPD